MASLVLGGIGAAVGSMFGPLGTQAGWLIGSAVGGMLDPQKSYGPRASDARVQASEYGAMITMIFGTHRAAGQCTWEAPRLEHENKTGGKGGPQQITYSYTQSFAISVCEGPDRIITRVWANGRVVWDENEDDNEVSFVQYPGSEAQLADPTIQAELGAANVPAYRGTCYVVFTDLDLSPYNMLRPNFEFEVVERTHTEQPMSTLAFNANLSGHGWPVWGGTAAWNGKAPAITAWPQDGTSPIRVRDVGDTKVYTYDQTTLAYIGEQADGAEDAWGASINNNDGDAAYLCFGHYYVGASRLTLWGQAARFRLNGDHPNPVMTAYGPCISTTLPVQVGGSFGNSQFTGTDLLGASGVDPLDVTYGAIVSEDELALLLMVTSAAQWALGSTMVDKFYMLIDGAVVDTGPVDPFFASGSVCAVLGSVSRISMYAAAMENDYRHVWFVVSNSPGAFVWKINDDGEFVRATENNAPGPSGTLAPPGSVNNTPLSVYALAGGCKLGVVSTNTTSAWLIERCTISSGATTYARVVDAVSRAVGLDESQVNTSDIEDPLTGYRVANRMPGRSIIEALMPYDFFDAVEYDCRANFIKRGGASVLTLDDDLLGAYSFGSEAPAQVQRTRGLEQDLPCAIDVNFVNEDADFLGGSQSTPRQGGYSEDPLDMNTAIAMTNAYALQVANANLFSAWYGRDRAKTALPPPYFWLTPADVVTLSGKTQRILTAHESMQGFLQTDLIADLAQLWLQAPVPSPGSGFTPQEPVAPQLTDLVVLDIPLLGTNPAQGVVHPAMAGADRRNWRGAGLWKSINGGMTFQQLLTSITPDSIGDASNALGNYGGSSFDEGNVLTVIMRDGAGDLSSTDRDGAFGGVNMFALGNPADPSGAFEIGCFRDAELIAPKTYQLTGLLRGLFGTAWAMAGHDAGDVFVLLPTAEMVNVGAVDYGATRPYKAATSGQQLADTPAVNFRCNAVSLAPYAPLYLAAGFIGNPDPDGASILMTWVRQSRVSQGWLNFRAPTGDGPPLGETIEQYRVRIWQDGTYQTVVNTYTVTAGTDFQPGSDPEFEYVVEDQETDFVTPLTSMPAWSVAQRGALGWGYETFFNGITAALPIFSPEALPGYVPPNPPPTDPGRVISSTIPWLEAETIYSNSFGPNQFWVIEINIGATPTSGIPVLINAAEYNGPPSGRVWTLSAIAGDFGPQPNAGAWSQNQGTNSVTAQFWVGAGGSPTDWLRTFPASSTAYLNIKNSPTGYDDVPMFATIKNLP